MKKAKRTEKSPVKVYLTEIEHERLTRLAKIAGYSRSSYMRSLLRGLVPKPAPSRELIGFIYELNKIGVNINQIAKVANMTGSVMERDYAENYKELKALMDQIKEELLKPEKRYGNDKDLGSKR